MDSTTKEGSETYFENHHGLPEETQDEGFGMALTVNRLKHH